MIAALLAISAGARAQMAYWLIRPAYDSIRLAETVPLVLTDSASTTAIWTRDGRRLAATPDLLFRFSDDRAVTVKRGAAMITGFYDTEGKFTPMKDCYVAYSYPYFSCGYMLVVKNRRYRLIRKDGSEDPFSAFVTMSPFSAGYARCMLFADMEKMKDPYYFYVDTQKAVISMTIGRDKNVDHEDVRFLSSLSSGGKGIAIVKKRLYIFDKDSAMLTPVTVTDGDKKRHVQINGDEEDYLTKVNDTTIIKARGGKNDTVTFIFDKQLRPVCIRHKDHTQSFATAEMTRDMPAPAYRPVKGVSGRYAMTRNGETVLPEQFDNVALCYGDTAIVSLNGRWGMMTIDGSLGYSLSMNRGNDIAFRHHKYTTSVRLDLPARISAANCEFDIPEGHGCDIDKTSVQTRDTESGNYVEYDCTLTIPEALPDSLTKLTYPVRVTCAGVTYPEQTLTVKAWHYKYVNVDISHDGTKLTGGDVEFTINISAEKLAGEADYPLAVDIVADSAATSVRAELEKLSETRYKCRLYDLAAGLNIITVRVTEAGCPPSLFPFEISYTKPAGKRDGNGQVAIAAMGSGNSGAAALTTGETTPAAEPQQSPEAATAPEAQPEPAPAAAPADSVSTTTAKPEAPADTLKAQQQQTK